MSRAFPVRFPISNVRSLSLIQTAPKWFDTQGAVLEYEGGCDRGLLVKFVRLPDLFATAIFLR